MVGIGEMEVIMVMLWFGLFVALQLSFLFFCVWVILYVIVLLNFDNYIQTQ